jgi:hypothetical protein
MSAAKASNSPDAVKSGGDGGKKKKASNGNMFLIILVGVMVVALVVGLIFKGGDSKKAAPKEMENASIANAANASAAKVYEKQAQRKIERSNGVNTAAAAEDFSNMEKLEYVIDPQTNIEMVVTPSGPKPVDSPEGQKFIKDFEAYQAMKNPNQTVAATTPQVSEQKLNEIRQESNEQVRALDEKINDLSVQVDGLIGVVKKQNETIGKLSTQIKTIQPMVKTPEELASSLFGKNGKKVLQERNNALVADVVVGDKAFITDLQGDVHIVRVGDVVPGTSSVVALIDESSKQVILKN